VRSREAAHALCERRESTDGLRPSAESAKGDRTDGADLLRAAFRSFRVLKFTRLGGRPSALAGVNRLRALGSASLTIVGRLSQAENRLPFGLEVPQLGASFLNYAKRLRDCFPCLRRHRQHHPLDWFGIFQIFAAHVGSRPVVGSVSVSN